VQENSVGASWLEGAYWGRYRSHRKKERLELVELVGWPSFSPLRNSETSEQAEQTGGSFRRKGMEKRGSLYQYSMCQKSEKCLIRVVRPIIARCHHKTL
jgi:hypothetical protein